MYKIKSQDFLLYPWSCMFFCVIQNTGLDAGPPKASTSKLIIRLSARVAVRPRQNTLAGISQRLCWCRCMP